MLLFRTLNSANQFVIYGRVADWCDELGSACSWSVIFKHWDIDCEQERTVKSQIDARGSEYVGASTWDWCSSIEESTEWPPREIRKSVERDKCLRLSNWLGSCGKSPSDGASEHFLIWMMGVEEKLEHAGSTHYFVTLLRDDQNSEPIGWIRGHTKIGPVSQVRAMCRLDQYGIEIQEPSMLKNGSFFWIVISRSPNRHVDEAWQEQEEHPQDVETESFLSVEESCAMSTSIEESHASKQQESNIPMNLPSKRFIPTDQRKWNDIPAADNVKTDSLACKISKKVMKLFRHQKHHREIDGANYWCSLLPMQRRDFANEGAEIFSDSRWLVLFLHSGSNESRFQYCVDLTNNPLYIRAIQGHSGGDMINPELLNYVAIPHGKRTCTTSEVHPQRTPCQQGSSQVGPQRKKAHRLLHSSGLCRGEIDEESEDLNPRKVHHKSKWKVTQDPIYCINLGKDQDMPQCLLTAVRKW